MRSLALFVPLVVAASSASSQAEKNYNSSSVATTSSAPVSQQSSQNAQLAASLVTVSLSGSKSAQPTPSPSIITLSVPKPPSLSTRLPSTFSSPSSSGAHHGSSNAVPSLSTTVSPVATPFNSGSRNITRPSMTWRITRSFNKDNQTRLITPSVSKKNGTEGINPTGSCSGCVIEAYNPITTFYTKNDFNPWTSIVVTATVVTEFITYIHGTTIDTVVTETKTVNQTRTVAVPGGDDITRTTPNFKIEPTPGVTLTVDAGPTYVIYQSLFGDLDDLYQTYDPGLTTSYRTCAADPTELRGWLPTRTEDWNYFIQTHTQSLSGPAITKEPVPIPPEILQYLKGLPAIRVQFNGSDLATCTLRPTGINNGEPVVTRTQAPFRTTVPVPPPPNPTSLIPGFGIPWQTFLSTTYATTSAYSTRQGCLRCSMSIGGDDPNVSNKNLLDPTPGPGLQQPPVNNDDPGNNNNPGNVGSPGNPGNVVTISDTTYTVRPGPTPDPGTPGDRNQPPPVVVGTNTLTPGQSTNIGGVPVVVPSNGGGSEVIIGGTTIPVKNQPTAVPILTVGDNAVTANPSGQFVVGTETLRPGGPAITVDGSTLSLGPSGNIAVVNGVTQTLANLPIITPPPAITVGGRVVSATVLGGTTQFVLGDQTLAPGNAITVDGTTYSLPSDSRGTAIIVNGVTSTLSRGPSGLTLGAQSITASVKDGTTAFIFSPSQTLTPGGVITVSGTTISMPASGRGSVLVINGVTSTLANSPITAAAALTINGKTYAATVRDGTTEFVIAPGTTLRPGEAVTIGGTTYSLDKQGTALVINGQTSTIPRLPASNSARTTSSSSSARDVGNFVWSGIGGGGGQQSSSKADGNSVHRGGLDKWVESLIIGAAGWVVMLF